MIGNDLGQRYEILEKIGSGGMGDVYKAHDRRLDRIVAIKILKSEYNTDENFIRKFRRESLAAASISHPNIVSIYDVGMEEVNSDNVYYIVMEYIEGHTLKEIISEEGPIAQNRALNYAIQIAEALKVAHSKNIVHRDIKSQNIMVTKDNRVKVTDFGIARIVGNSTVTMTNSVMGSVHYFSPEQAKGSKVDQRSDIYSLGIVLYEMLTGDVPFDAENPISVALMHIQNEIPSPSSINTKVSPSVDKLVEKLTMKDPKERYANVDYIISDIKDILLNRQPHNAGTSMTIPLDKAELERAQVAQKEIIRRSDPKKESKKKKPYYESNPRQEKKKKGSAFLGVLLAILLFTGLIFGAYKLITGNNAKDLIVVPSVVGYTEEQARIELEENFDVETIEEEDESSDPGIVLEQKPTRGKEVKKGSVITLTISKEIELKVPDLKGLTEEEASAKLKSLGLSLEILSERVISSEVEKDRITRTKPRAGQSIKEGETVSATLSSGPSREETKVPDLKGLTEEDAKLALESVGLKVGEVKEEFDNSVDTGEVIRQQYASGTVLEEGDTVDLIISKGPEEIVDDLDNSEINETAEDLSNSVSIPISLPNDDKVHSVVIMKISDANVSEVWNKLYNKEDIKEFKLEGSDFTGKKGDKFQVYIDGSLDDVIEIK